MVPDANILILTCQVQVAVKIERLNGSCRAPEMILRTSLWRQVVRCTANLSKIIRITGRILQSRVKLKVIGAASICKKTGLKKSVVLKITFSTGDLYFFNCALVLVFLDRFSTWTRLYI